MELPIIAQTEGGPMKKQALRFTTMLALVVTLSLTTAVPSANAQHGGVFDWFFNIFYVEPSVADDPPVVEFEPPASLTSGCVFEIRGRLFYSVPCPSPGDDYLW